MRCREIGHAGRAQIAAPGTALADPGEHDEGIGEPDEERVDRHEESDDVKPRLEGMRVGSGLMQSGPKIGDAKALQRQGEVDLQ